MQKNITYAKFQPLLIMLYITTLLAANVLIYKITILFAHKISVGSFIIPFLYVQADIITEVYGYSFARKIIWISILCEFIFSIMCKFFIMTPSPNDWHYIAAYNYVLGSQLRIFIGNLLGTLVGAFINIYLISRWKILTKGRFFIFRSIGSSTIGQLAFTVITLTFDMFGMFNSHEIINFIAISYSIKLVFTPIASTIAGIISFYLKRFEGIDQFDMGISFNPLKIDN